MDISNITQEDVQNMSIDEVKDYIRELIHEASNEQSGVQAALLGPNGEQISFAELADKMGEEKVVEMLASAMKDNSGHVHCSTVTKEQYNALMHKRDSGEKLTEEEEVMLKAMNDVMKAEFGDPIEFQKHILAVILEIIQYSQETVHYDCSLLDLITVIHMITMETLKETKDSKLSMYKDATNVIMEMSNNIANDIMDTWKKSLSEEPDGALVIIGLATALANAILEYEDKHGKEILLPPIGTLREDTGIGADFFESENESENGSNENVININEVMRNKLKE